ncbi:hypothetical protein GCM10009839_87690 [Catenulispora yoronensis]|uniref:Uncharacterized protein n=1 Tax=Catenulispora yoronensis TaxID=450799 RepID=A0ABN2VHX0_9ACTN
MDLANVVMSGAQSLVTAVLTDSWGQVRSALCRLWARHRSDGDPAGPDPAALSAAHAELDLAREQALAVAGQGPEPERAGRMELFWAGYLAGQLAARPELADAVRTLPMLLEPRSAVSLTMVTTSKDISGTVHGNVAQTGDVSGGIRFGR